MHACSYQHCGLQKYCPFRLSTGSLTNDRRLNVIKGNSPAIHRVTTDSHNQSNFVGRKIQFTLVTGARYAANVYTGVLALLGSGETAPGMTKVHRQLLAKHPDGDAINLDTPYGFQLNVPQMTEKLVDYFNVSLQRALTPVSFTNFDRSGPIERVLVKQTVRDARYVFAGPGSPSYALAQWRPLELVDDFAGVLETGGTLCFSSAATLTLGSHTAPIYEIYKVGATPYWLEGLDLLGRLGIRCAVIPHFDNHEGGNYDTRYCYLGEPRLESLESQLPDDVAVLGIDEHTALLLDLETDEARVVGRGHAYWRHGDNQLILDHSAPTPLAALRDSTPAQKVVHHASLMKDSTNPLELAESARRGGPEGDAALAALTRLASATPECGAPDALIEALLDCRNTARAAGDFATADKIRRALDNAGIALQDSPTGTTWSRDSNA